VRSYPGHRRFYNQPPGKSPVTTGYRCPSSQALAYFQLT
jgi:hypothetical protein